MPDEEIKELMDENDLDEDEAENVRDWMDEGLDESEALELKDEEI